MLFQEMISNAGCYIWSVSLYINGINDIIAANRADAFRNWVPGTPASASTQVTWVRVPVEVTLGGKHIFPYKLGRCSYPLGFTYFTWAQGTTYTTLQTSNSSIKFIHH